jgi:hypothetical protein
MSALLAPIEATMVDMDTSSSSLLDYEDGEERLGFISIGSNGVTSLAFNATSIQENRKFSNL